MHKKIDKNIKNLEKILKIQLEDVNQQIHLKIDKNKDNLEQKMIKFEDVNQSIHNKINK